MCFSETASFTVAAACAGAGIYTVYKCPSVKYLPLALIPLAFALQQASEGLVWHALDQSLGRSVSGSPATLFVFFATVVWPLFVPLSVVLADGDGKHKRVLWTLVLIGGLVSVIYLVRLLNADVMAAVAGRSIQYTSQIRQGVTLPLWLLSEAQGGHDWILVPYAMATIGSLASSTLSALRWNSGVVALALTFLMLVEQTTLVSLWCFFAASASLLMMPAIRSASVRFARLPARAELVSRQFLGNGDRH